QAARSILPGECRIVRRGSSRRRLKVLIRYARAWTCQLLRGIIPAPMSTRVTEMSQPFAGVTVLEFGHFIAVPWAGQTLADGGAHVIKIEPQEGEPSRHIAPLGGGESRHFLIRNRGKHTLPLDLRHPDARAILDALLARADVVLANMRPGLAAELGLEYEQLAPRYPRLVVGTVTAFGPHGPDAARAGMDHVVQARSGLMVTGGRTKDGLPTSGESPIADYMAAALLAFGVTSALYRRVRQRVAQTEVHRCGRPRGSRADRQRPRRQRPLRGAQAGRRGHARFAHDRGVAGPPRRTRRSGQRRVAADRDAGRSTTRRQRHVPPLRSPHARTGDRARPARSRRRRFRTRTTDAGVRQRGTRNPRVGWLRRRGHHALSRSEEHTSELQSRGHLVC